jgi:hypothetical protein
MARSRNRDRRPGRRPPYRDPRPTILIVSEGTKTEPQYLLGIKNHARNPRVDIRFADSHGVPTTLIREAKKLKLDALKLAKREKDDNLAFDSVWCVFDVDDHPGVANVKEMARDNQIDLAISNPCFELWLLLHYRDSPGMQHRQRIYELLREHVPTYNKIVDFSIYVDRYQEAIRRARQLDQLAHECDQPGQNPTTSVYELVEAIESTEVL